MSITTDPDQLMEMGWKVRDGGPKTSLIQSIEARLTWKQLITFQEDWSNTRHMGFSMDNSLVNGNCQERQDTTG